MKQPGSPGWQRLYVVDMADGPGGGIALLTGYVIVAGGAVAAIVGLIGLVPRIRSLK